MRIASPAARAFVAAVLLLAVLTAVAAACPLCKEDVAESGPSMWRGMFWSILLMMSMPFAAVGTVIFLVRRGRRKGAPAGIRTPTPTAEGTQP